MEVFNVVDGSEKCPTLAEGADSSAITAHNTAKKEWELKDDYH